MTGKVKEEEKSKCEAKKEEEMGGMQKRRKETGEKRDTERMGKRRGGMVGPEWSGVPLLMTRGPAALSHPPSKSGPQWGGSSRS